MAINTSAACFTSTTGRIHSLIGLQEISLTETFANCLYLGKTQSVRVAIDSATSAAISDYLNSVNVNPKKQNTKSKEPKKVELKA